MSDESDQAPAQDIAEKATHEANTGSTNPQDSTDSGQQSATGDDEQPGGGAAADEKAAGPAEEADPGQEDNPATSAPVE